VAPAAPRLTIDFAWTRRQRPTVAEQQEGRLDFEPILAATKGVQAVSVIAANLCKMRKRGLRSWLLTGVASPPQHRSVNLVFSIIYTDPWPWSRSACAILKETRHLSGRRVSTAFSTGQLDEKPGAKCPNFRCLWPSPWKRVVRLCADL